MATAFSRTMRSLAADSPSPMLVGILLMTFLLGAWLTWGCLSQIAIYDVTQTARLEVDRASYPVMAPVSGPVVTTRMVVGQEVQAGDVLIELDAETQRLQREEARARLTALTAQLAARREEVVAEEAALQGERQAAQQALAEAHARRHEAKVAAQSAENEAAFYTRLQARGLAPQLDLMRSRAEVQKRRVAADTLRLAVHRLEGEQQTRARDRLARLEGLKREAVQLEGELTTAAVTLERLAHEIEQRRIRAPTAGRLGEVANLRSGTVVRAGDSLGAILPPSTLKVVAHFPSAALGRLQPSQPVRVRLAGFPWMQYGSIVATVTSVAHETRNGQIRVELTILPDLTSAIPLQHGLPGSVEVEVEHVAPVTLVLRAVGKRLGTLTSAFDARAHSETEP